MPKPARFAALLAAATVFAIAAPAVAAPVTPDLKQCVDAHEKGQRAQKAGKLREARDSYLVCGQETCPLAIRRDCSQWSAEIANAMPTVVFGAKDAAGKDLFDVSITIDGEPLAQKLDGKAVAVDPGPHTFRFETNGRPAVTERLLVKEGERARVVNIVFTGDPPAVASIPPAAEPAREPSPADGDSAGGHTVFPWILFGAGIATLATGLVVFAATPERPANCDEGTRMCTRLQGQSDAALAEDQDQAARADSQGTVGLVVAGVGTALAIGGLVWHFLEPSKTTAGLRTSPWVTAHSGGLAVGGRF